MFLLKESWSNRSTFGYLLGFCFPLGLCISKCQYPLLCWIDSFKQSWFWLTFSNVWITFFDWLPLQHLEMHFYGQSPTPSDKNCRRVDSAKNEQKHRSAWCLYWAVTILNFVLILFFFKPSTTYCPLLSPHDRFLPCYHLAHFHDSLEMFSCLMV